MKIKILLLYVLVILQTACSSSPPKPEIDFNDSYDFASIKSYAMLPRTVTPGISMVSDIVLQRMELAVEHEMDLRGYQYVDKDSADIWIAYNVVTSDHLDVKTYESYNGGYRCYRCRNNTTTQVDVREYQKGLVIIDIVDAKQKMGVWRGTVQGRIKERSSPEDKKARIGTAVANIFSGFPP